MDRSLQGPRSRGRWRWRGAAGVLTIGLAVGALGATSALAGAATKHKMNAHAVSGHVGAKAGASTSGGPVGGPGGPVPVFTISSIGTSSLTVETPDGTTSTVTLTDSTTYTDNGVSTTEGALAVGDRITVLPVRPSGSSGSGGASGSTGATAPTSLTAASVNIVSPRLAGTVVSVTGASPDLTIVVEDAGGFWRTIVTSAATTYTDDGSSVTTPTITTGEFLSALGSIASDHTTLDAASVALGKPTGPGTSSGSGRGGPGGLGGPGGPGGLGGPGRPGGPSGPGGSRSS